ncbi:hypothetical protein B0T19DRAFT_181582 [Cercophora scortea]|uniref:Cyanovirin-N domain-containing protein n=1 Tax=Cercophora scortea TaxID=314031 RepID=A0AAE0IN56_9PEZI|nr:hypothetical protein B0T19DRAFT_181582 [Cercophora scortea]
MRSIFTAVILGLAAVAQAENFFKTCDASSVKVTGKILQANCKNIAGALKCSKLNLNECLKNSYGSLKEDPTGAGPHYGDQCINCSNAATSDGLILGASPTLLHCQCNPGTGAAQASWPTAVFDIDTIVDNINGVLWCFDTKAASC